MASTAQLVASRPAFAFTGKTGALRNAAMAGIASLAYVEAKSRADVIAQLVIALGKAPTAPALAACQLEYVAGRVAQRLPVDAFPKTVVSVADRIAHVRKLVTSYAAPAKDGVKARKLAKGIAGRRSIVEHKAIRAAEETWSLIKSEMGFGAARTMADKNKKQASRAPAMAGSTDRGKAGKGITHSELVKADGPMTREAACDYITSMAATLLAFTNKHAGVVPTDHGAAIRNFKDAVTKAERLRKSVAE